MVIQIIKIKTGHMDRRVKVRQNNFRRKKKKKKERKEEKKTTTTKKGYFTGS